MTDLILAIAHALPLASLMCCVLLGLVVVLRAAWRGEDPFHLSRFLGFYDDDPAGFALIFAFSLFMASLLGRVLAALAMSADAATRTPIVIGLGVFEGLCALLVLTGTVAVVAVAAAKAGERRDLKDAADAALATRLGPHGLAVRRLRELGTGVPTLTELAVPASARRLWVRGHTPAKPMAVVAFDVEPHADWRMTLTVWHLGLKEGHRDTTTVAAPPDAAQIKALADAPLGLMQADSIELQELVEQIEAACPRAVRRTSRRSIRRGRALDSATA